ncbi:hypothetical protein [Methylobacterium durans]|jgi:hypothetical protein|uniref:hypothetical protein n=1 Tax=Methylobacterium durans TaxID=2202825 RepID=UPI001F2FF0EC|nr:hypothetical protein [Methylobacterium durans]
MAPTPLRPTATALARYPIPVELIAALYRADATDFARLVAHMPEYGRARIAAYCVERERLHHLGVRLAATCGEAALIKAAGAEVGAALFAHARIETAETDIGSGETAASAEAPARDPAQATAQMTGEVTAQAPAPALAQMQIIDLPGASTGRAPQDRARAA